MTKTKTELLIENKALWSAIKGFIEGVTAFAPEGLKEDQRTEMLLSVKEHVDNIKESYEKDT